MGKRRLRHPSLWIAAVLAAQMPLGIEVPPDSSRTTAVYSTSIDEPATARLPKGSPAETYDEPGTTARIGVGGGSYMTFVRDCEGRVVDSSRHSYADIGAQVNHRFKDGVELGVRGGSVSSGFLNDETTATDYVNPYIGIETRRFGLGAGAIVGFTDDGHDYYPSGHIRIGPRTGHFSLRILEGMPVCSGGGVLDIGAGWRSSRVRGWVGFSLAGAYDGAGGLLNLSFYPVEQLEIGTSLRIGISESEPEYGGGLSLGWHLGR